MARKGWFKHSKGHSLASYGIPSKTRVRTPVKEPNMSPLAGGRAEGQSPTRYDQKQLEIGTQIEMEHTDNPYIARQLSQDHLEEHPDYYKKLVRMERGLVRAEKRKQNKLKRKEEVLKRKKRSR